MIDQPHDSTVEQPPLPLELREPVPGPRWAGTLERETEGNQDTGWWGA